MSKTPEPDQSDRSVSRRDLLRRGAIAGGLAWTAPLVIQSLTVPAGAQTSPTPPSSTTSTTSGGTTPGGASAPLPVTADPDFPG
jgi:hypothetical protein